MLLHDYKYIVWYQNKSIMHHQPKCILCARALRVPMNCHDRPGTEAGAVPVPLRPGTRYFSPFSEFNFGICDSLLALRQSCAVYDPAIIRRG